MTLLPRGAQLVFGSRTFKTLLSESLAITGSESWGKQGKGCIVIFPISGFVLHVITSSPSPPRLTSFCEKSGLPHAVQSGIWLNLFYAVLISAKDYSFIFITCVKRSPCAASHWVSLLHLNFFFSSHLTCWNFRVKHTARSYFLSLSHTVKKKKLHKSPLQRCVDVAKFLAEVISDLDEKCCSLLIYRCAVAWFLDEHKHSPGAAQSCIQFWLMESNFKCNYLELKWFLFKPKTTSNASIAAGW